MNNRAKGIVTAVSISSKKGMRKTNAESVELKEDFGIIGDAHAGPGDRQISLLAEESIRKMTEKGLDVSAGDFAENITTKDMDLVSLDVGTKVSVGEDVILEISRIGKVCHSRCSIYYQAGDCVMPKEGVFARVLKGGEIHPGSEIVISQTNQLKG